MQVKFREEDPDCIQIGDTICQKGWSYPAEIMVYGDLLVLRCTRYNCILRSPRAKRISYKEPYLTKETFNELIKGFCEVSVEHTEFTVGKL